MATYEEIRALVANASDSEKLYVLGAESVPILGTMRGYSQIIYELVKERGAPEMPDDFLEWCERLINASNDLKNLIDAITFKGDREVWQQEKAKRDQELGEALWKDAQAGLPELVPYSCLRDAIEQVSRQMNLSFDQEQIRIDDTFLHPGSSVNLFCMERGVRIGAQREPYGRQYMGYSVTLNWRIDHKNLDSEEYVSLSPSLHEAIKVLYRWLIEQCELSELVEQYQWLKPK